MAIDDGSRARDTRCETLVRGRRRGMAIGAVLAVGASVVGPAAAAAAAPADAAQARPAAPAWPGLSSADSSSGVLEVAAAGESGAQVRGAALAVAEGGIVVTHSHVVAGATSIVVTDPTTGAVSPASVLVRDERADVAVLQLASADGVRLATLREGLPDLAS
ncbi:Serine protease OS=Cellulomonas persica OX=76861 GN=CPE01_02430 PE=4 SV=1 [Cellulomonas persica]